MSLPEIPCWLELVKIPADLRRWESLYLKIVTLPISLPVSIFPVFHLNSGFLKAPFIFDVALIAAAPSLFFLLCCLLNKSNEIGEFLCIKRGFESLRHG